MALISIGISTCPIFSSQSFTDVPRPRLCIPTAPFGFRLQSLSNKSGTLISTLSTFERQQNDLISAGPNSSCTVLFCEVQIVHALQSNVEQNQTIYLLPVSTVSSYGMRG
jgi:hypothetical protein